MINLQNPVPSSAATSSTSSLQFVDSSSSSNKNAFSSPGDTQLEGVSASAQPSDSYQPSPGLITNINSSPADEGINNNLPGFLKFSKHPVVCVFHLAFKVLSLLTYLFGAYAFSGGFSGDDFVFTFVLTTVFISLDFWTVKNVTGRILVGMRWWNDVKDDGSSEWVFESTPGNRSYNATDRHVFWITLNVAPVLWVMLATLQLFHPIWLVLCCIAVALTGANTVGYWKCAKDQRRQVNQWATSTAMRAMFRFGFGRGQT